MTGGLVTLTQVETRSAADLIVTQLAAYGIAAHAPAFNGRSGFIPINVSAADLEDARALITPVPPADQG